MRAPGGYPSLILGCTIYVRLIIVDMTIAHNNAKSPIGFHLRIHNLRPVNGRHVKLHNLRIVNGRHMKLHNLRLLNNR